MGPSFTAFTDEVIKLSAPQFDKATKARWKQGAKNALVGGVGMGIGAGLGGLATRAFAKKVAPMLNTQELKYLGRGAAVLGGAGGLAISAALARNRKLLADSEKKASVIMRALRD
jgi:hypothetical protein